MLTSPSLAGLPGYGVTLSGSPNAPVIVNNSDRSIIGYVLRLEDESHRGVVHRMLGLRALRDGRSAGIPPGSSQPFAPQTDIRFPDQTDAGSFVSATLDAVLFSDGEFAGPDRSKAFDDIVATIAGEQHVANQLLSVQNSSGPEKDAVWSQILQMARGEAPAGQMKTPPEVLFQKAQTITAGELVGARDRTGEDAAFDLAVRSGKYPNLWRQQ
jgi:hypothetical protein